MIVERILLGSIGGWIWSPFSYKLPVISSPTRTLLRQRYIGFAVPSFFFALLQVFKMYEKEDAPTERVKLLTLLSGEEDFELSR